VVWKRHRWANPRGRESGSERVNEEISNPRFLDSARLLLPSQSKRCLDFARHETRLDHARDSITAKADSAESYAAADANAAT
jgi:hypothetical protein